MRICIVKETGRIIGMQYYAPAGLLTANAKIEFGLDKDAVEEKEVTESEYLEAQAKDPVYIAAKKAAEDKEKANEDAKAKISSLADDISKATTIAGLKTILLDLVAQLKTLNSR